MVNWNAISTRRGKRRRYPILPFIYRRWAFDRVESSYCSLSEREMVLMFVRRAGLMAFYSGDACNNFLLLQSQQRCRFSLAFSISFLMLRPTMNLTSDSLACTAFLSTEKFERHNIRKVEFLFPNTFYAV